ncbi:HAD-IIIA family hydrolase [Solirhodobacter olei]|uniref:HAD-IIIA family hydrolase n=1 Tax=Solirhodobacter olei TaxID=2493082 RepID=UPI0019D4A615|nr:HAD-IIIA family hydrolase [Solirhodobacter olei]
MLRQAVVLVGGLGTRLGALTADVPKPMLPVGGEPFLDILLRNIARHGFEEVILLARHQAQKIRDHYASGRIGGAKVKVIEEAGRAGTGGALREAADLLDDVFLLSNGDSFFDFNYLALAQRFGRQHCNIALALREVPDTGRFGQVSIDQGGRILHFAEKLPSIGQPGLINGGVYVAARRIIDDIGPGEVSLETDVMPRLVEREQIIGMTFEGYFLDIGMPETYEQAQVELPAVERRKVVFLDRDGTLNRDDGYTHRTEDLVFLPGAVDAVRRCNDAGRLVIVVTNQAGIARGYFDVAQMREFNREMNRRLQDAGAHVDAFYFCPHHPNGSVAEFSRTCDCRKPGTGLFEQARSDWRMDLDEAIMIGDKPSDLQAARAFGIRAVQTDGTDLGKIVEDMGL